MACGAPFCAAVAYSLQRSRQMISTSGCCSSHVQTVCTERSAIMRDKPRKVNPPAKQPRHFGVAPDGYIAALDLSHTALRAESEGERYTGVLHRPTLAFALRV